METPLEEVWQWGARRLGGLDAIDLSRELVDKLDCPSCGRTTPIFGPGESIPERELHCELCQVERVPHFFHSLSEGSPLLNLPAEKLGLPPSDIVWLRGGDTVLGIELANGDPITWPPL